MGAGEDEEEDVAEVAEAEYEGAVSVVEAGVGLKE